MNDYASSEYTNSVIGAYPDNDSVKNKILKGRNKKKNKRFTSSQELEIHAQDMREIELKLAADEKSQ